MEQHAELYSWNRWGVDEMIGANFRCRMLAYSVCIHDFDHGSISFSLRVTTIRQDSKKKTSSICGS
jgi:hypothetical protein